MKRPVCFRQLHLLLFTRKPDDKIILKGRSSGLRYNSMPSRFYTVAKVIKLLPCPIRARASLYSYGDSAGVTPASLLIPIPNLFGLRKPIGYKFRVPGDREKIILNNIFIIIIIESQHKLFFYRQ